MPWIESEHPRGQPENAGQFASKGGGGSSGKKATVELNHQSEVADRENIKRWKKDMTEDEKRTVQHYLGDDGYEEINEAAREGSGTPEQAKMVNDLERVIQRAGSLGAETDVFRGITNSKILDQIAGKVGQRIVLRGFQSTSKRMDTALKFSKDRATGNYGAMLRIKTSSGMDVGVGQFGGEGEVLLGHGWEYEVESVGEVEVTAKNDDFFPLSKPPPMKFITLRVAQASPSKRKQSAAAG